MKNLYLIEYGCSICTEHLVVLAESEECADEFAYQEAQSVYWSYDCNYLDPDDYPGVSEEELAEIEEEEMEYDIFYSAVEYDPTNKDHISAFKEQDNRPHEI